MREGGCWPKRPIAVLTVRMSAPKSLQFSVFFSSGSGAGRGGDLFRQGAGRGIFFVRGREGGCWPKRPKAPCVYRIPLGPHVLCGHSREFCEKRGFRKIPLRGGGHPGRRNALPRADHCRPHGQDVHSQIAAIFRVFFVMARGGKFLRQGAGGGLLAEAAKGPPPSPPTPPASPVEPERGRGGLYGAL